MDGLRMIQMANGHLVAQAVYVAAKLGIADQLASTPATSAELADSTRSHPPSLHRLLRTLAAVDVLAEDDAGTFSLTALGATLRSDAPASVRDAVLMAGDPLVMRSCGALLHAVQTGEPGLDHVFGRSWMELLRDSPEFAHAFHAGTASFSATEDPAIASAYDWRPFTSVVDVGGGRGGFLAEVLKVAPALRGVLYDLPEVVDDRAALAVADLLPRCDLVGGSFLESVPPGGDVYVLKRVLHDWDDASCVDVLRNCRRAMAPAARLLVVDAVVPPGGGFHPGKLTDLFMLIVSKGRERSEADFRVLYEAAGLTLTRVVATPTMLAIVEGVPT